MWDVLVGQGPHAPPPPAFPGPLEGSPGLEGLLTGGCQGELAVEGASGWAGHLPFEQLEEGWEEHSSESKGWEGGPCFWPPSFPPLSSCGQSRLRCWPRGQGQGRPGTPGPWGDPTPRTPVRRAGAPGPPVPAWAGADSVLRAEGGSSGGGHRCPKGGCFPGIEARAALRPSL